MNLRATDLIRAFLDDTTPDDDPVRVWLQIAEKVREASSQVQPGDPKVLLIPPADSDWGTLSPQSLRRAASRKRLALSPNSTTSDAFVERVRLLLRESSHDKL